jgi:putative FmdB family regulatory protein
MPMYEYKCKFCEKKFKTMHSITEQLHDCEHCNGKDTLEKVPSLLTSYNKQKSERDLAGERVEKAIEDNRKLLLDQQEALKKRDYKP